MAALPYMPLYIADYLADAAHLSAPGHGAYLLLLMTYWQRGEALPDDDWKLARIARMSDEEWLNVRDHVREFFIVREGVLVQERVERELENVRVKTEQASRAGIASAKRRSRKGALSVEHPLNVRSTPVQRMFNDIDTDKDKDSDSEKDKNINPSSFASDAIDTQDCHPGLDPGSSNRASDEPSLSLQDRPNEVGQSDGPGSRVKPGMTMRPTSASQLMPLSPQADLGKSPPKTNIRASEQAKRYFAEFWAIYPKRICNIAAEERFYAALKARVAPQRILDGARRYAESVKETDAIYVSAPDVWLAKGRYDDEYAQPPPPRENLMTRLARGDWETNDGCAAIAKLEYAGTSDRGAAEPADALAQCDAPDGAGPL